MTTTITYEIDENDFLRHQLYIASKSDSIRKKRKRSKLSVALVYVAFALLSYFWDNYVMAAFFFLFGVLWFFIYPLWEKKYYRKHYQNFIDEHYKNRVGKMATVTFSNDFILAQDDGSESKVHTTEIEEIIEIPTTILVKLKGGQSFIFPKDKIDAFENLKTSLLELAIHLKIKYTIEADWEWK